VSIFDWLGPLSAGGKRRGWDALPAPISTPAPMTTESKALDQLAAYTHALTVRTLVHGPGASDLAYGPLGSAGNSAVFACLQVIATAIGEPELRVYRTTPSGRVVVPSSPLGDLLASPNPVFALDTLLAYVSVCQHVEGNAYWRKLRSGDPETGNVVALWPISPTRIGPWTDPHSSDFITAYRYFYAPGRYEDISTSNIVHFRYGLDDRDHRVGTAPLKRLAREVSSDEQATRYADRLLANLAINGLTLTFDKEAPPIDQATADELKARISAAYGGDNAGSTAVLSPGATLTALGFSPEQMDLKVLHRVPEERISAVLGVPAIVAGLGAGLDRSTYANFSEAREAFTETKLLPLWASLAADLTIQLVPDFTSDRSTVLAFDTSEVRALATDQNAEAEKLKTLVEAGIISTDEARAEIGLAPRPAAPAPAASSRQASPTAASFRPHVITLPTRREQKAIEDLPREYEQMRADDLPAWVEELAAFFESQQRRVVRRLRAGADTGSDLVPEAEAVLLRETLTPLQLDALDQVSRLVAAELGIAFQLDDPATRRFLADAGVNIGGITETTRSAVQAALIEGQQAGEGIPQLARRLRDLPGFGAARATMVARTELGTSQNLAAISSYRASGVVVGVRVLDGDADAACAAMDGRAFPLGQEPAALQHPNCVRAFAPLTSAEDLVRSA
jgi:HK97 family phage portal protein